MKQKPGACCPGGLKSQGLRSLSTSSPAPHDPPWVQVRLGHQVPALLLQFVQEGHHGIEGVLRLGGGGLGLLLGGGGLPSLGRGLRDSSGTGWGENGRINGRRTPIFWARRLS